MQGVLFDIQVLPLGEKGIAYVSESGLQLVGEGQVRILLDAKSAGKGVLDFRGLVIGVLTFEIEH